MFSPETPNQPLEDTQSEPADQSQVSEVTSSPPSSTPSAAAPGDSAPQRPPAPPQRAPFVSREERDRRRREALQGLVVGEWREGKVTGIATFGAFVDLGGVDGLVHVSQLGTGGYVERVEDVVQVGQTVRVRVAEVDMERGRVSLSMREARPAAPPRTDRPAAPAAPRPPRAPSAGPAAPTWGSEPLPEHRPDRRNRGDRPSGGARDERPARRSERPRRSRDQDDQEWRNVRGDIRGYYSFGDDVEEEPAPTTAEELVARFGRRDNNREQ